jgi:hypothetical protein
LKSAPRSSEARRAEEAAPGPKRETTAVTRPRPFIDRMRSEALHVGVL